MIIYEPKGVCSKEFRFTIQEGKIASLEILGGCDGNLKGIRSLVVGMDAQQVVEKLKVFSPAAAKELPAPTS